MRIVNTQRVKQVAPLSEKALIEAFHRIGLVSWGEEPFTLKSGAKSHVYVNARSDLTRSPNTLAQVGGIINETVWSIMDERYQHYPDYRKDGLCPLLIGIPTAGTALAFAAGLHGHHKIPVSIMRESPKNHGASRGYVEGAPNPKYMPFLLDNVAADGESKREGTAKLVKDGYNPKDITHLVLVDREQGALEQLRAEGYSVEAIFKLSDIGRAYVEMKLWKQEQQDQLLAEINRLQLA